MTCNWLSPYVDKGISFVGAYCLKDEKSRYSYLISKSGKSIILSENLVEKIVNKNIDEMLLMKLISHGMVYSDDIVCCNSNNFEVNEDKTELMKPQVFVIDITKVCNLNCIYCFRDLNERGTITLKTLLDICEFIDITVQELNIKDVSIQLWGGEPIYAMDKIRVVSDYFSEVDYDVKIDIETNATLITEEIAEELWKRKITVGVSVDGMPEIQNYQRPFVNGKGTSKAVEYGIKNLKKYYGDSFGSICVITKKNFNKLQQIIDYYVTKLDIKSLKFNIVRDNPNADKHSMGLTVEQIEQFVYQLVDIIDTYHILGVDISEGNILTKYNNLTERNSGNCCISCGCTGGIRILSFDINGNIFPCEMTDYDEVKIGNIYSGKKLMDMINEAKNNNGYYEKKTHAKCIDCPWFYFCRGGCKSRVHYINRPDQIDEVECAINNMLYPKLIEKILRKKSVSFLH